MRLLAHRVIPSEIRNHSNEQKCVCSMIVSACVDLFSGICVFGWMGTFGFSHASVGPESGTLKPAEVAGGCIAAVGHHR